MTDILKGYDVFYEKRKRAFFRVRARNEEEAKIIADNLLMKDRNFDGSYDAVLCFDNVHSSIQEPLREPDKNENGQYIWKTLDYRFED
jgi:hypothetical protein